MEKIRAKLIILFPDKVWGFREIEFETFKGDHENILEHWDRIEIQAINAFVEQMINPADGVFDMLILHDYEVI